MHMIGGHVNNYQQRYGNFDELEQKLSSAIQRQNAYEDHFIDMIASDNARSRRKVSGEFYYRGEMTQEGLFNRRPYAGAKYHDEIEEAATEIACSVFGADHANLQLHSCSQANQAAYFALLEIGDPVLSLDFKAGGHLTHGMASNFSGKLYRFHRYGTNASGFIDYDVVRDLAKKTRPKLILCGSSAYPRNSDYGTLRAIADEVEAYLMCDVAHEAGLIAAGVLESPIPAADVVTMSLDKTLRGISSAIILCKQDIANRIDRGVHPGTQSSFPVRRIAESAATLVESQRDDFLDYARRTVANAQRLSETLLDKGISLVTGGTDKHFVVADTARTNGIGGAKVENLLERAGILTNRQTVPLDKSNVFSEAGGLRVGSVWATSRGLDEDDFCILGQTIASLILCPNDEKSVYLAELSVKSLLARNRENDVWNS